MNFAEPHKPVFFQEVCQLFHDFAKGTIDSLARTQVKILDLTYGRGGHLRGLLNVASEAGLKTFTLAVDRDATATAHAASQFSAEIASQNLIVRQEKFSLVKNVISDLRRENQFSDGFDFILADFGVSSPQLDQSDRGFSFMKDGPLDMRMDQQSGIDAGSWINRASESELVRVLFDFGEEKLAKKIARKIVYQREIIPFTRTHELRQLCEDIYPPPHARKERTHPATRTFQAFRMVVNQELDEIKTLLADLPEISSGKSPSLHAFISFHSLEDRLIKRHFRDQPLEVDPEFKNRDILFERNLRRHSPVEVTSQNSYQIVKPFPFLPTEREIEQNPRARSAKLRAALTLPRLV